MAFFLNILYYLHHQPSLRQQGMIKEVASQLRLCKMGEAYSVQRFLLFGGALNRRTLNRVESLFRNGTPPFHGAKDRPGSPRGGQSALDAHSWWNFILCSVSIGNHVQCFEQYFILVVPPLQRLKSFESSLRTLKCVCVDYSYHIRKLAYSWHPACLCHLVIGTVVKYKWWLSHPGDRLSAFRAFGIWCVWDFLL